MTDEMGETVHVAAGFPLAACRDCRYDGLSVGSVNKGQALSSLRDVEGLVDQVEGQLIFDME